MSTQPVLLTKGVTKRFGDFVAVNNVDFELIEKETLGIIGPNGAGKTTFINLLTGYYTPEQGQVFYQSEDITHLSPAKRVKLGIVRTFQLVHFFDNLTVADNLGLAYFRKKEGKPFSLRMFYTSLRQTEFAPRIRETLRHDGADLHAERGGGQPVPGRQKTARNGHVLHFRSQGGGF